MREWRTCSGFTPREDSAWSPADRPCCLTRSTSGGNVSAVLPGTPSVLPFMEKFFGKHRKERENRTDSSKRTEKQNHVKSREFSRTHERYSASYDDGQGKMTEKERSQILSQQDSQKLHKKESPEETAYRHYSQY